MAFLDTSCLRPFIVKVQSRIITSSSLAREEPIRISGVLFLPWPFTPPPAFSTISWSAVVYTPLRMTTSCASQCHFVRNLAASSVLLSSGSTMFAAASNAPMYVYLSMLACLLEVVGRRVFQDDREKIRAADSRVVLSA